jgi:hypothetical protein
VASCVVATVRRIAVPYRILRRAAQLDTLTGSVRYRAKRCARARELPRHSPRCRAARSP